MHKYCGCANETWCGDGDVLKIGSREEEKSVV